MWALLADPGVGWEGSALSSDHADRAGYSCEQLIIKVDPLLFIYYRQNPKFPIKTHGSDPSGVVELLA